MKIEACKAPKFKAGKGIKMTLLTSNGLVLDKCTGGELLAPRSFFGIWKLCVRSVQFNWGTGVFFGKKSPVPQLEENGEIL